ncbi:FtsK/SpoIIIE family protein [Leuconostoc gelidum subsp. gasicomitatum]|nr:FtsK/SpoIIIE family protein [Leuconostoc gasicomitatum]
MKYKTIKYSDQYLAKTLFKRALLFVLVLVTVLFLPWYWQMVYYYIGKMVYR